MCRGVCGMANLLVMIVLLVWSAAGQTTSADEDESGEQNLILYKRDVNHGEQLLKCYLFIK